MEDNKFEFLIDSVVFHDGLYTLGGICNAGIIKKGCVFTIAFQTLFKLNAQGGYDILEKKNIRSILVTVRKITAYRKELDELPVGLSGAIVVQGQGCDQLLKKDIMQG